MRVHPWWWVLYIEIIITINNTILLRVLHHQRYCSRISPKGRIRQPRVGSTCHLGEPQRGPPNLIRVEREPAMPPKGKEFLGGRSWVPNHIYSSSSDLGPSADRESRIEEASSNLRESKEQPPPLFCPKKSSSERDPVTWRIMVLNINTGLTAKQLCLKRYQRKTEVQ
jgi:hypothetical protein